jgi:importin-5
MLDTLSSVPQSHFSEFISSMYRLAKHKPGLFQPHLQPLLSFLRPRIVPSTYAVSTPTESNPTPSSGQGAFPHSSTECKSLGTDIDGLGEEEEAIMKAALEFMITLSEAGSTMVIEVDGWVAAIVRGCLEGMGTLRNDDLDEWLETDVRAHVFIR